MKRFMQLSLVCLTGFVLFTLLNISPHLDKSFFAVFVGLAFSTFFTRTMFFFYKKYDFKLVFALQKCLEYSPFVALIVFVLRRAGSYDTATIIDAFCVVLWLIFSLSAVLALRIIAPKKVAKLAPEYAKYLANKTSKKPHGIYRALCEITGWLDALIQAIFMVMLVNIFILQLYEIPSESMVPEFLIKDRVIVFKTLSGPKFPLSQIGLPYFHSYKRGDIVVFRNPHYSQDRRSEVKTVVSQLVYMCTLTTVNLNTDADGNPKADPLVKRVCAVPGEQIVMQDGILYHRTKEQDSWQIVTEDAKWASWNLNAIKPEIKRGIKEFPITDSGYSFMEELENKRRSLDIEEAYKACLDIVKELESLHIVAKSEDNSNYDIGQKQLFAYNLFNNNESMTRRIITQPGGLEWFHAFMLDWHEHLPQIKDDYLLGNIYDEASYKLNLLAKLCIGRLYLCNAKLLKNEVPFSMWQADESRNLIMKEAQNINAYIFFQDRRNLCVFPPNDKDGKPTYIPENCYFMMGDNRFNSLDMRHSYDEWLSPLTLQDKYSVLYLCSLSPQYVSRAKILGTSCYRFWPLNRVGIPGLTGGL